MNIRHHIVIAATAALTGLATPAQAQPEIIALEGDTLVLASGEVVTIKRFLSLAAAGQNAWAAAIDIDHGPSSRTPIIGRRAANQASAVLAQPDDELTPEVATRGLIDRAFDISPDGRLVFSAGITTRPFGVLLDEPGFLDSLWLADGGATPDAIIAMSGLAPPASVDGAAFWSVLDAPRITRSGSPAWRGGLVPQAGAIPSDLTLLHGLGGSMQSLLRPGTDVGIGWIANGPAIRSIALAPAGKHAVVLTQIETSNGLSTAAMRLISQSSGAWSSTPLVAVGGQVGADAPGRWWTSLDAAMASDPVSCGSSGRWAVLGRISAPAHRDSVFMVDGQIAMREGQAVAGADLVGSPLAADMAAAGDYAVVWPDTSAGAAGARSSLYFNGTRILSLLDSVPHATGTAQVTHIYPILACGEADAQSTVPVYIAVQLAFNPGGLKDALLCLRPTGSPPSTCDGDVNCDFSLDGFDVITMELAVGGDMTDFCQADPDFNCDQALDGFDVEAVELVVGGGPCP